MGGQMRKKVLTRDCTGCDFCQMTESNKLECTWGKSKVQKILESPKRKTGYPKCNLIKVE
jgi:hypothetical protein